MERTRFDINHIIMEGHDAFWRGDKRMDCPYPESDEFVEGMQHPVTCKDRREDWLIGWDMANNESV